MVTDVTSYDLLFKEVCSYLVMQIHIIIQHTSLTYHTHIHTQTHNMDENIHKYPCTTTRPPSWWLGPSNFQVALDIFYMLYTFAGA